MTVNYSNNQPSTTIAVWTVHSLSLTTPSGSSAPDKLAIAYNASTTPTTTLTLASIRDITFSGSPLYTGDTMRIARKNASVLSVLGASVQKITFESLSTGVVDRNSRQGSSILTYPNPSALMTNIELNLLEGGNITAIMYDIRGNEVARLTQGYREAGKHTLQWTRKNTDNNIVPAGVYLFRITRDSVPLAETMLVLY